jgi:Mor family transcriptional regulator
MAEFVTNEKLLIENIELKSKVNKLEKQLKASNKRTSFYESQSNICKKRMSNYIEEHIQEQVMDHFNWCKSIKDTAREYKLDMEVLYDLIPIWFGDGTKIEEADDYEECMIEVMGRKKYDAEIEFTTDEMNIINRAPDLEEMNKIIWDYINTNMSLYELADKYNLKINNLFRLLKINNLIVNETDAKGYHTFYTDYFGTGFDWDFETEVGMIS